VYLTWSMLFTLILAVGIVWFWQDSLRIRDRANAAAMEACARMGLQFLDGTVAFSKLKAVRDVGRLRLRRTYVFDYTANSIGRLQGFVVLLGGAVETVGFASAPGERTAATPTYPPTPTHPPTHSSVARPSLTLVEPAAREPDNASSAPNASDGSGKVFDLEEWRKTHRRHH
jgi:hypothetical protein